MWLMERVVLWILLGALVGLMGNFLWQMAQLAVATGEAFDALEAALEARDG